ncbi:hypothetical protein M8J75_010752 [Diaphorina citri]|nr:hypothetical protein M8J75_010752 [Diaphorina citri]KAI5731591.1 hypothetical protein M8J77_012991 [Diaphorina citri]
MKLRWILSILMVTSRNGIAQIFPMSSLLHYFDKSYPYYVTHTLETAANHDIAPATLMPYSNNNTSSLSDASLSNKNNTIVLQATRTTILSNISNIPVNITSESYSTSWNDSSNFKSQENTLITSSSNDQPVTIAEPWTRNYQDVFGSYGMKAAPSRHSVQKVKKLKPKYDQVAYVYPPPFAHPPPPPHQAHAPPIPHPSHPPHPNHYVVMKPFDTSGEIHHTKLDLNPLVPPSNEVTIDYYVTSSSPTYFEEPELTYFPPGVEHIAPIDSDIMHTKKHYAKNIHRPSGPPLPTPSQVPHAHHPYPFYNQQQIYVKPTPSYPPVKKFIATVRPIFASASPPVQGHTHTTHIIKYTTPANSRYRVLPTLVDPLADSLQPLVDHHPPIILGSTKTSPPAHDLFVPPRVPPLYYHDYHNPYSTVGPYTINDLKHNRNLLKQFNKFVNQKEKRKKKKKKNESEDEEDDKNTKEDYEYEYEEKSDKDEDDNEDADDDESPRKRKLKKIKNKHKNNKIEESRLESYTRPYPMYKAKIKKNVKEPPPFSFSGEGYEKFIHDNYPPIPKNHKLEQMEYGGSWEKKGISGESVEMTKPFDDYKPLGSNHVDVQHDLQADPQEQTKSVIQNSDGQRVEFQMHGQGGPESYKFGYDTGAGYNRQFRYEERDGEGHVKGHYGYYDDNGKLQVFNYAAHPEHGFQAEQTNANYDDNGEQSKK